MFREIATFFTLQFADPTELHVCPQMPVFQAQRAELCQPSGKRPTGASPWETNRVHLTAPTGRITSRRDHVPNPPRWGFAKPTHLSPGRRSRWSLVPGWTKGLCIFLFREF